MRKIEHHTDWCSSIATSVKRDGSLMVCLEPGHKHLLTIHNKPLKSAPPRLQRLLIKIHGYNFQLVYRSSCQMIIAGTLSRLPNPEKNAEIPLDVTADDIPTAKMMKGSTIWTSSTSAPENESS
ncbi:hypothetical protein NP493_4799g00000 [Ridgeia piscesae]|uniref:Uncharacterized protein n=1 Tax=Ridgeia piscesae TaxID=27915 RepID=A0AAD9IY19_RIDPI|nr:hypothetical protein NP493_4799g00000 [Ridgeia piscesae]